MFHLSKENREKEKLYQRLILFALVLFLLVIYFDRILYLLGQVMAVCTPFVIGGFIAFVLNVIASQILKLPWFKHWNQTAARWTANIAAIACAILVIMCFVFVLLPNLAASIQSFVASLPQGIQDTYTWLLKITENVDAVHDWLLSVQITDADLENVMSNILSWFETGTTQDFVGSVYGVISATFSWVFAAAVSVMFSIIVLFNKPLIVREGKRLLQAYVPEKQYPKVRHILLLINTTFTNYIGGSCLECIILGSLVAFFSWLFRLPYALMAGFIVGIGALVPMFGALFAAILVALLIGLQSWSQGLTFIILFICIQQVEGNFIYPNVVGKSVGLPPVYVAVAVTLGASAAGILGMILFIPVFSCLYQIIKEDADARLAARKSS